MDVMKELKDLKVEVMAIGDSRDKVEVNKHINRIIEHFKRSNRLTVPEFMTVKKEGIE